LKIANLFLSIVAISLIFISACSKDETSSGKAQFQNPVFEPVIADPSIIKGEDGNYYAYGTEDDWGDGKGAKYIPIINLLI
jgi:arabinan endo-1,5-alpha-L-arabinosidase